MVNPLMESPTKTCAAALSLLPTKFMTYSITKLGHLVFLSLVCQSSSVGYSMTFSLSRFHFRLKLVKQFLLLFGVGFLGLYFPVAGKILSPAANLTIMEVGKSQAKFNLATEKTTLSPKDEFTLTISVNTNSPIYFAQAILEFDPQVL